MILRLLKITRKLLACHSSDNVEQIKSWEDKLNIHPFYRLKHIYDSAPTCLSSISRKTIILTLFKVRITVLSLLFIIIVFNNLSNCKNINELNDKQKGINGENQRVDSQNLNIYNYGYVINPNGISLYDKAHDLKSKSGTIAYGGKLIFTDEHINSDSDDPGHWFSIQFNDKKGFVYSIDSFTGNDWFALTTSTVYDDFTKKNEPSYSIIQTPKAFLYELPSLDSKQIGEVEQFTLVRVISAGTSYDNFISNNIDLEMGNSERTWYEISFGDKHGFVFNSINYPSAKHIAESQIKEQILINRGYFLLTSKRPTLYHLETKQPLLDDYKINVLRNNQIFDTNESRLINGEQVHLVYLSEKINVKLKRKPVTVDEEISPYAAYVAEKDGKYFTEKKFSDYTVANTRFKGDLNAITVVRNEFEKRDIYLNYIDFSLRKVSEITEPSLVFYIASAYVGYFDKAIQRNPNVRSIILKKTDGVYEAVSGSIFTNLPIQFKDLDGDKVMEIIAKVPTRGGDETIIYGLRDEKYISINSILSSMNIHEIQLKGKKIIGKKWISSEDGKDTNEELHYFKYDKGDLVELQK